MKRLSAVIICTVIMISMITVSVSAAENNGVLTLPKDDGTGYPITGVSDFYSYHKDVNKVIVPESIVRLEEQAFYACTNLKQIKLHDNIQRIGKQAFEKTAYYEDSDNWFDGVLYIGDVLIKANPDIVSKTYQVKAGTRLIADGAFENCKSLKSIVLPDTIEYVGADAFSGTALMTDEKNWLNNSLIINHVLVSVEKEYNGVFSVPDGIRTVADGAFEHSKVTEVTTPESLKFIGYNAFWDCQELVSVHLGKSVETLGRGPFRMCNKLKTTSVHADNKHFSVVDGVLYNHQVSEVIRCPQKMVGYITLPNSVKNINAYSFECCDELERVDLPFGCVFIGNAAFYLCTELKNIIFPTTMEYIDSSAFSYRSSLESIVVPDNVYYLGKYAFNYCLNLKEVVIGNGVKELKYCLFESCKKLDYVTLGKNIRRIDDTVFLFTKYVSNVDNYKVGLLISSDKYLIKVAQDVRTCYIPDGITIIADGAFENLSKEGYLREVYVPSSIECFNWGAFYDIPETVPIYYDGTIEKFIDITNFDRNCINLYTSDVNSFM